MNQRSRGFAPSSLFFGRCAPVLATVAALLIAGCGGGSSTITTPLVGPPTAASAVQYAGNTNPAQVLDVIVPASPGTAHPVASNHFGLPVLIFIHGGAWTGGSRLTYNPLSQTLANYGFVVFNVDYRLSPAVTVAGEIQDSATAESWVLQNAAKYGGDTTEVFVMGHSAGGHLVAMTMIDPQWLTAAGASRSQFRGWLTLSGSMNIASQNFSNAALWPPNAATTLNPLLLPVAGARPVFASCTDNDAPFGCPDRNTLAGLYTAAQMDVTTFLDPGQTHLSQVQPPEANNPNDPMYVAIHTWMTNHF
jgi:acetyl esterase/lipase